MFLCLFLAHLQHQAVPGLQGQMILDLIKVLLQVLVSLKCGTEVMTYRTYQQII